ncbi:MAG TPA: protein-glutamate O-methyltransferase CheR [Candidatus Aquilonibacter sp.]|nr:protein-glutamate O-methyltransferase CheR [Candidatus Aquilonibacter sp.]
MKSQPATDARISDADLCEIRTLIEQRSAVHLDESRERFLSARVREHAAEKSLRTGAELLHHIRASAAEYEALLERVLTQETSFFRYPAVYEAMGKTILPGIQERKFWQSPRTLRIWSAGCSTGEEPYSIAITLCDSLKFAEAWEIEILATDISRRALRHAEKGAYSKRSLQELSLRQLETHFTPAKHGFHVRPRIRRMISFAQMNLAEPMYVGKMDCIFCMNVLMYFTEQRRRAILQGFYEALEPGGYLMLGHSETLTHTAINFEAVTFGDCRLYRRPASTESGRAVAVAEGRL